jgi:hypothetical protein
MPEKNWLFLSKTGRWPILLNLDRIQSIEILSDNSLAVRFGEKDTINLDGIVASEVLACVMERAIRPGQKSADKA